MCTCELHSVQLLFPPNANCCANYQMIKAHLLLKLLQLVQHPGEAIDEHLCVLGITQGLLQQPCTGQGHKQAQKKPQ